MLVANRIKEENVKFIDFRSDTVTQPTPEMREAMANAIVGDDVYQDDPTVNLLEETAAKILGKPAAIFVSSGTMGNQLAVMAATKRGDEIIIGETYHLFESEVGGIAVLSGAQTRTLPFPDGIPDVDMIAGAIRGENIHYPDTAMICLENAVGNGRVVPVETMNEIYKLAKKNKIHVHVDGARAFNAAVALGIDVKEITKNCDSIMCCLSKGLCAPVGSIVAGEKDFIEKVRKYRKMIGGGTRQAGIIAAAGLIAITEMTKRLHEDHENARYLARKLAEIDCIEINPSAVEINMVFCKINKSEKLLKELPALMYKKGIKINDGGFHGQFRFLTSNDTSKDDIDVFIATLIDILAENK